MTKPVRKSAWFRGVIGSEPTGEPVTVWARGIADYAGDIDNAKRMVVMRRQELAAAEIQLQDATAAFIQHCAELDLPIDMEPTQWPRKDYKFEELE